MLQTKEYYDVIVAGGGLSGVAAAIAAAREGAKVLLFEQYGFLGGMATAGLVNPFMPYWVWTDHWEYDTDKYVNRGVFAEILAKLSDLGGLHQNRQTYNEEILKLVLDRMIAHYGVKMLLHSFLSDVDRDRSRIKSITVSTKSGEIRYGAKYFIDATGDADMSTLAECEYRIGRDADSLCQPMTLCFRVADIDMNRFNIRDYRQAVNLKYKELREKGRIRNPREDVLMFEHMAQGVIHFNSTRITHKSNLNVEEFTQAEISAREQVYELYTFIKGNVEGFEKSTLLMTAPQIGVRESRRIVGEYTITQEDLVTARKFEDSVARGTYPVDIHNPSGTGTTLMDIPYGDYYTIPYRALIPKGVDNLIVAGRPISSTHEAHSAYRVMPICTCIGEGAGIASAVALKEGIPFRQVDYGKIHRIMDIYGALY